MLRSSAYRYGRVVSVNFKKETYNKSEKFFQSAKMHVQKLESSARLLLQFVTKTRSLGGPSQRRRIIMQDLDIVAKRPVRSSEIYR